MYDILKLLINSNHKLIGFLGRAGSGKTTLIKEFKTLFPREFDSYSIDWRFFGDSEYRKNLLKYKENKLSGFLDAVNQYNWWDWDKIYEDIYNFKSGGDIIIENYYDRDKGEKTDSVINIFSRNNSKLICEGALLGSFNILELFDIIVIMITPAILRFQRLLNKDSNRRNIKEIIQRFLITEYSENLYYNGIFKTYNILNTNIIFIDETYSIIENISNINIYDSDSDLKGYFPILINSINLDESISNFNLQIG